MTAQRDGAEPVEFEARVRIDTPREAEYFRHGGILQYVLRGLLAPMSDAEEVFPQVLRDLLAAHGPSGYETAPAAVWRAAAEAFGAEVDTDLVGTPRARVAGHRRRSAATAGDGPHRRDRADRDAHRRRGLPVVRCGRRLGRAGPGRPARQLATREGALPG